MLFDNPFFDKLIRLFCLINYIRLFKGFFLGGGGGVGGGWSSWLRRYKKNRLEGS